MTETEYFIKFSQTGKIRSVSGIFAGNFKGKTVGFLRNLYWWFALEFALMVPGCYLGWYPGWYPGSFGYFLQIGLGITPGSLSQGTLLTVDRCCNRSSLHRISSKRNLFLKEARFFKENLIL